MRNGPIIIKNCKSNSKYNNKQQTINKISKMGNNQNYQTRRYANTNINPRNGQPVNMYPNVGYNQQNVYMGNTNQIPFAGQYQGYNNTSTNTYIDPSYKARTRDPITNKYLNIVDRVQTGIRGSTFGDNTNIYRNDVYTDARINAPVKLASVQQPVGVVPVIAPGMTTQTVRSEKGSLINGSKLEKRSSRSSSSSSSHSSRRKSRQGIIGQNNASILNSRPIPDYNAATYVNPVTPSNIRY